MSWTLTLLYEKEFNYRCWWFNYVLQIIPSDKTQFYPLSALFRHTSMSLVKSTLSIRFFLQSLNASLECPCNTNKYFHLLRQISFKTRDASQISTKEGFRQYWNRIVSPPCLQFFNFFFPSVKLFLLKICLLKWLEKYRFWLPSFNIYFLGMKVWRRTFPLCHILGHSLTIWIK